MHMFFIYLKTSMQDLVYAVQYACNLLCWMDLNTVKMSTAILLLAQSSLTFAKIFNKWTWKGLDMSRTLWTTRIKWENQWYKTSQSVLFMFITLFLTAQ